MESFAGYLTLERKAIDYPEKAWQGQNTQAYSAPSSVTKKNVL
jgi:hypothetical protein